MIHNIFINTNCRNICTLYLDITKMINKLLLINMGMWRNGSALDSKSKVASSNLVVLTFGPMV